MNDLEYSREIALLIRNDMDRMSINNIQPTLNIYPILPNNLNVDINSLNLIYNIENSNHCIMIFNIILTNLNPNRNQEAELTNEEITIRERRNHYIVISYQNRLNI